jgi:hypothetical protein
MLYALCSMLYALCSMLYALCSMLYALCLMFNALFFIWFSVLKAWNISDNNKVNAFGFIYMNLLKVYALSPRKPADFLLTLDVLRQLSSIFVFVLFAMQHKVRLGRTKRYHLF